MAETSTNLGRVSLVPRGEYDPTAQYRRLDIVSYNGSSYLALRNLQGVTPADGADYMLIACAGEDGAPGADGADGAPGNSIASIERTSGTGAAGTTDTYTITMTDGSAYTFQVYNGADGSGTGDMTKSTYDPQGKSTDVFAYADEGLALKQPLLAGQPGQVVGFDADGAAVAQDAPDQADAVTVPGGGVMELGPELGEGPYTFELEEDDEAAVSAAQVSYDGTQSGLQAETVQGAVDALSVRTARVSNPNMLDNAYWASRDRIVNQRGKNLYPASPTHIYTIDRLVSVKTAVEVKDNGLAFTPDLTMGGGCWLDWRLDGDAVCGKTVTLSALIDGELYSFSDVFPSEVGQPKYSNWINGVQLYITNTMASPVAGIIFNEQREYLAKAAKLELGPQQTLARKVGDTWVLNDPPPDKALELAKCQRYMYNPLYGASGHYNRLGAGFPLNSKTIAILMPLPTSMRINPAITFSNLIMRDTSNYAVANDVQSIEIDNNSILAGSVTLICTPTATVTPGKLFVLESVHDEVSVGTMLLDANL